MQFLRHYDTRSVAALYRKRHGESRIGEHVAIADRDVAESIERSPAQFVLLGIPEDIGVRANYGRPGAGTAVRPAFESFLNLQSNQYMSGESIMLLGEVETDDLTEKAEKISSTAGKTSVTKLRDLVSELDVRVSEIIRVIVAAGKIPIVVGGGHNNSYGCLRGCATALKNPVNAVNFDQHLDFRALEGRHSGNGFSYAFADGWLRRYAVFGCHEQYNNAYTLKCFADNPEALYAKSYDSIFVREETSFRDGLMQSLRFVKGKAGIEIDLDAIANVPSSAKSSSGFSVLDARRYVYTAAKELDSAYLHIAEGAPVLAHRKADNKTGKLIAYLICDFVKGCSEKAGF